MTGRCRSSPVTVVSASSLMGMLIAPGRWSCAYSSRPRTSTSWAPCCNNRLTSSTLKTCCGTLAPSPDADWRVGKGHVHHDQLARTLTRDHQLGLLENLDGVTSPQRRPIDLQATVDQIEVSSTPSPERMAELDLRSNRGDVDSRILMHSDRVCLIGPDHFQQAIPPILRRELPLLDSRGKRWRIGEDPQLQEFHRLAGGAVLLGVKRPRPERHELHRSGLEQAVVAEAVSMAKTALPHVGDALHV